MEVNIGGSVHHHAAKTGIAANLGAMHIAHLHRLHLGVPRFVRQPNGSDVVGEVHHQPVARIHAQRRRLYRLSVVHIDVAVVREAG